MEDLYDVLLDEYNKDSMVLIDSNGRKIAFEQIAVFLITKSSTVC